MLTTKHKPTATFLAVAALAAFASALPAASNAQARKKAEQPMIVEAVNMESPGLSGARHPTWASTYNGPGTPMKLSDAIQAVFPPAHPSAKLEFDENLTFNMLTLPTGQSRSAALDTALRNAGLGANIAADSFVIYKVKGGARPAPTQAATLQSGTQNLQGFSNTTVRQAGQTPGQALAASNQAQNFAPPAPVFQPAANDLPQVAIAPPPVRGATAFNPVPRIQSQPSLQPVAQRAAPSASNLNEQPGAIEGELVDPSWLTPAPRSTTPVPTAQAIGMLFPPEHPSAQLIIESDVSQKISTWRDGMTRRMAMSRVLADAGLIASFANGVFKVKASPLALMTSNNAQQFAQRSVSSSLQPGPGVGSIQQPVSAPLGRPWNVSITDVNLSNTFTRWAAEAGYKVKWDAPKHLLIGANQTFNGTFEEAVEQALGTPGIRNSLYPLEVCVYANTPPLARITRLGEQSKDCR